MAAIETRTLVMAGPMRWIVLEHAGRVTTLAWFAHVHYTAHGAGNVLFARSDLYGSGQDDVFAVFSDNAAMAAHLRDDIFDYSVFAGGAGGPPPAPIVAAEFHAETDWPHCLLESMRAEDGTDVKLWFWNLGTPQVYVRAVNERITEVGTYSAPGRFQLEIGGIVPVGKAETGPLAGAPPLGADLQNLWYC